MSLKSYINTVISPDDHSIDSNFMKIVLNKICDGLDSKTSKTEVGNLSDLNTTAKTNIVAAINEAAQSGGTSATVWVAVASASDDGAIMFNIVPSGTQNPTEDDLVGADDVSAGDIIKATITKNNVTATLDILLLTKMTSNEMTAFMGALDGNITPILITTTTIESAEPI